MRMQSTMMPVPLSLNHFLERARLYHPKVEIVSRMPDKSLHRHTYADFHRRAKGLAEAPNVPTAAAIANGVAKLVGTPVRQLPMTAERVWMTSEGTSS